ncbi:MAG: ABC transporter permease [Hyphomicrobiales bacterium]|nr:ABC transporter permease [Hyphomicrobiales bacterium]
MQLPRDIRTRRWLGLGPAMVVIGIFMVLPMMILVVFSFLEADPYGGVEPVFSLEAYIQILYEIDFDDTVVFNPIYLNIIARSVGLALVATFGCLILGFPVAYFITRQSQRNQNMLLYLITLPFWTNLLIRTYSWILILAKNGVVEQPLLALGVIDNSLGMMYTNGAIAVGLIYTYLPLMVLPIYASLEKLDFRLVEAAHDLYAGRLKVMREIIAPLAMPGIIAGCILVFVPSLGAFIAPDLLGGGKKLMLGSLIQLQFSSSRNWPFGSAIAVCLLALVMISLIIQARSAGKRRAMEG